MTKRNNDRKERKQLAKKFGLGLYGVFRYYPDFYRNSSFWISLIISLIFTILTIRMNKTLFLFVEILDLSITIMPGVMGLSLAAFAIIVSFGESAVIAELMEPEEGEVDVYTKTLAVFAFVVLLHVICLIIALMFYITGKIIPFCKWLPEISYLALFFQFSIFCYSILSVKDLVSSVFSFGRGYSTIVMQLVKDGQNKN